MLNDKNSGGVMRRWATSLWVAAILCVLFYGCLSTKPSHIIIAYHAQEDVNRIDEAGNVAIKVTVVDLRTEADDKGTRIVGYRHPTKPGLFTYSPRTGPIFAKNDLSKLIAHAIETELNNLGFKSGERVLIEVDLIKFHSIYAWFTTNIIADPGGLAILIFHIDVKKPDGTLVYSNLVRGRGISPNVALSSISPKESKLALEAALKDGISRLVNDPEFLNSLLKASVN